MRQRKSGRPWGATTRSSSASSDSGPSLWISKLSRIGCSAILQGLGAAKINTKRKLEAEIAAKQQASRQNLANLALHATSQKPLATACRQTVSPARLCPGNGPASIDLCKQAGSFNRRKKLLQTKKLSFRQKPLLISIFTALTAVTRHFNSGHVQRCQSCSSRQSASLQHTSGSTA